MTNPLSTNYQRHGDVAEIQLVNPPVNGLGHEVRQSLHAHLSEAVADAQVHAIVLTGAGKMFCGGADIRQFNTPKATALPMLRDINRLIESSAKPVIAVIHGNALGGGLELAMSCHYRIAATGTRLALPEVKLGILPGGGGTQRLPRLVGLERALDMIVSGEAIDASEAHACGLLDAVVSGDLLNAALSLARTAAQNHAAPLPVTSARHVRFNGDVAAYLQQQRTRIAQAYHGFPAPLECLVCLETSLTMPFEEALTFERTRVQHLVDGPESKALRYLFFAEREVGRLPSSQQALETQPDKPADARRLVARMVLAYQCEALLLWLEGVAPVQVDQALQSFGMAHGCFEELDAQALDEQLAGGEPPPRWAQLDAVRELLQSLGQPPADSSLTESAVSRVGSADAMALAKKVAAKHRVDHHGGLTESAIVERLLCAAAREHAATAGTASTAALAIIDWFWVRHHGFPAWRGGPMHYLANRPTTIPLPLPGCAPT